MKEEKSYSPQSETKNLNNSISLKELYSGKNIFLNDLLLENELNLINIWASWCLPCKDEHPFLMILSKNKNIEIASMADIPAGTGLGSSGSFLTSLIKAFHIYKKIRS